MKKQLVLGGMILAGIALPVVANAQSLGNVQTLIQSLGRIVALLIPIAFAAALLFFFWGLAVYIQAAGDEGKRKEGKGMMIWGVIALFIMASIWGVVAFIGDALGIDQGAVQISPTVPGI